MFSPCPGVSKRFCSGEILLADGHLLLLVCVYFPYDNGLAEDIYKFGAVLSELEGFLESRKYDLLAVVGDFNVQFARTNVPRTDELHQFMEYAGLEASDLLFPSVQFTYESDSGKARSWVDHFLFSAEASSAVKNVMVLHSSANLSDHLPLSVVLNCHPLMSSESVSHDPPLCSGRCLAWHRASAEHIAAYQSRVGVLQEQLVILDEVVRCSNPYCLLHCELLNSICHELVHSLLTSAEATIPRVRFKKGVARWNDEIRPLREKSLLWNRLWREMAVLKLVFCFSCGSTLNHGIGML